VDTNHFKGNYPESCSIEGCRSAAASADDLEGISWTEVLGRTRLGPHRRHHFAAADRGPFTHVRFNIYPDGGVSRLRLHGRPVPS
jgi:allantoicase